MNNDDIDPQKAAAFLAAFRMSDEDFAANLRHAIGIAHSLISKSRMTGLVPVIYVHTARLSDEPVVEDGPHTAFEIQMQIHTIYMADWHRATYKGRAGALGYQFAQENNLVRAIYYVSEAWNSKDLIRADGTRKYKLPEDDPNRREVIQAMGMSADGRVNSAHFPVRRDKSQKMWPDGEIVYLDHTDQKVKVTSNLLAFFYKEYGRGLKLVMEQMAAKFN